MKTAGTIGKVLVMGKRFAEIFAFSLIIASCSAVSHDAYPLLDGDCEEYPSLNATAIELNHGVTVWAHQDAYYGWLCVALPEDSYGTMDIIIDAPSLDEPLNLHISSNIGEWPASQGASSSERTTPWWNNVGWSANPIAFSDLVSRDGPDQIRWHLTRAREIQLSKTRFGETPWNVQMHIRNIKTDEGMKQIRHPMVAESGSNVWSEIFQ